MASALINYNHLHTHSCTLTQTDLNRHVSKVPLNSIVYDGLDVPFTETAGCSVHAVSSYSK